MENHLPLRDRIAGLEKGLCLALQRAGYQVINKVHSNKGVDEHSMSELIGAFATRLPLLASEATE